MKKIELPKEAIWRENRENEMYWFYEEFQKGGKHAHWEISLYECEPVIKKGIYEGEEYDDSYKEYIMVFKEKGYDSEYKFRFRDYYNDNSKYKLIMIYNYFDECINDIVEDDSDLAGCCRSAMYYFCSRV